MDPTSAIYLSIAISTLVLILYNDVVWAIIAWIRYTKVVRQDLWHSMDMAVWRRKSVTFIYIVFAFLAFVSITIRISYILMAGSLDIAEIYKSNTSLFLVIPFFFVGIFLVPWVLTLVPYILMVWHVRNNVVSTANSHAHAQHPPPSVFVINEHGQQMDIREAWVEGTGANQGHTGEEVDKVKVMSVSLTSMAALGTLGVSKIVFPCLFIGRVLISDDQTTKLPSLELGLSIKVGEDLFGVLFSLFNCRNLISLALSDMYWQIQEGIGLSETEGNLETFSQTMGRPDWSLQVP